MIAPGAQFSDLPGVNYADLKLCGSAKRGGGGGGNESNEEFNYLSCWVSGAYRHWFMDRRRGRLEILKSNTAPPPVP